MVLRQLLRFCVLATVVYAPVTAVPAAAQTSPSPVPMPGSLITNAGVARANAAVDSVFVQKKTRIETIDVGDFTGYLLARLGVPRLDDSLKFRVSSDTTRIRIRGRLMDFPAQARAELGPIFSFVDSTAVLVAELSMPQYQDGVMKFRLQRVTVGGTSIPEFFLSPALSEYARRYPVLSGGGRELLVAMPPEGSARLVKNAIELRMPGKPTTTR
ncbi:MAG: hypothetical protein ABIZ70_05015 [Gemmatimonadales bacterium]